MNYFTIDDVNLLLLVKSIDGEEDLTASLATFAEEHLSSGIQILSENDHLRGLLRTFLEKNVAVQRLQTKLSSHRSMGWLERARLYGTRQRLEVRQLANFQAERDAAFKPYEMLRKLTASDVNLLIRYPA